MEEVPPAAGDSSDASKVELKHLPNMQILAGLQHLSPDQLCNMVPPVVTEHTLSEVMRTHTMPACDRITLLSTQKTVWGDDEVLWNLVRIMKSADSHVHAMDPLLVSSWANHPQCVDLRHLSGFDQQHFTVVSAAVNAGHWTPCVWVKKGQKIQVFLWEEDGRDIQFLQPLHASMAVAMGASTYEVTCNWRSFKALTCGAATAAFVESYVLGEDLPSTADQLDLCHIRCRDAFRAMLTEAVSVARPWCWGAGQLDSMSILIALLQLHGVPNTQSQNSARMIMQSLGHDAVHKAITGISPWKSLKALANQHQPAIQLVLPDELNKVMEARPAKAVKKQTKNSAKQNQIAAVA